MSTEPEAALERRTEAPAAEPTESPGSAAGAKAIGVAPLRPQAEAKERVSADVGCNLLACYQCGKCSAGCSVSELTDLLPHKIVRLAQLGERDEVLRSKHIWICTGCGTCTSRCPNQVDVARIMDRMKAHAIRTDQIHQGGNAKRFHEIFLKSVETYGRNHEFAVLRKLKGIGGMIQQMGLGLTMMRKGKIKLGASKVRAIGEVRQLMKDAKEGDQ